MESDHMLATPAKLSSFRNAFFSGLILLAPLAVTFLVFSWLVQQVGGPFRKWFFIFIPDALLNEPSLSFVWDILSTIIVVLLITLLGYVSRLVLGRYFGQIAERAINNLPGLGTVYRTVKQIVDTFSVQKRNIFEKVVLIQFPREGSWVIGFLTNQARGEVQARTERDLWTIFMPTTPNPTSGFLLLIPREDIRELDMSVGDAMKLIISGGTVTPPWPAPVAPSPETLPPPPAPPAA
ncbi:MAG: DUF502 domain-containing protein [Verrucomicrobiota bacterium]